MEWLILQKVFLPLFLLLEFFPLKFAVIPIADKRQSLIDEYVFNRDAHITGSWEWAAQNLDTGKVLLVKADGELPTNVLKEEEVRTMEGSRFLFGGDMEIFDMPGGYEAVVHVTGWSIVDPIDRGSRSWRRFYAPRSYLTPLDFDWYRILTHSPVY